MYGGRRYCQSAAAQRALIYWPMHSVTATPLLVTAWNKCRLKQGSPVAGVAWTRGRLLQGSPKAGVSCRKGRFQQASPKTGFPKAGVKAESRGHLEWGSPESRSRLYRGSPETRVAWSRVVNSAKQTVFQPLTPISTSAPCTLTHHLTRWSPTNSCCMLGTWPQPSQ